MYRTDAGSVIPGEPSPDRLYLRLLLKLDPILVGSVLVEVGHLAPQRPSAVKTMEVCPLDASLLDAVVRLVRLLDVPPHRIAEVVQAAPQSGALVAHTAYR